jgi:hypothetical protein
MSNYYSILQAVAAKVAALPALAGRQVVVRPMLQMWHDEAGNGDKPPLVIVAPRKDQWESVPEVQFANQATVSYPVLVAVVITNAQDLTQLGWQLDCRDAVRRALFAPLALGASVPDVFDVVYEPNPRDVETSGLAPPLDVSVQQFDYLTGEPRADP